MSLRYRIVSFPASGMFEEVLTVYLALINVAGFASMGIDKRRAMRKEWRIPERVLFLLALLGGSIGSNLGMQVFRHKTKHWYFVWGMPCILLVQIILAAVILLRL